MAHVDFNSATVAKDVESMRRKLQPQDSDPQDDKPVLSKARSSGLGARSSLDSVMMRLGSWNPFVKPVGADDIVWLLDNTAFRSPKNGQWEAEYAAAVFEREAKCKVVDMVTGIASNLGLADDAEECKTIEERLLPFLWDVQPARTLRIAEEGRKDIKLGPSGFDGIVSQVAKIPGGDKKQLGLGKATAKVPRGVTGILDMQTFYAEPEGWSILSDIDDTIKVTMTSDPTGVLRETFVNPPTPVEHMPELYAEMQSLLPENTPWFYLSASPYNLYPFLRNFRNQYFPPGTLILRDQSWRTVAGLLSALTMGTEEYKADRLRKVHGWVPKRKMIIVGDSTQSDPEAYGDIYREIPGWIRLILIRKVSNIAAIGANNKNEPERFEEAFRDVPRDAWHVFEDPRECSAIIRRVIGQS